MPPTTKKFLTSGWFWNGLIFGFLAFPALTAGLVGFAVALLIVCAISLLLARLTGAAARGIAHQIEKGYAKPPTPVQPPQAPVPPRTPTRTEHFLVLLQDHQANLRMIEAMPLPEDEKQQLKINQEARFLRSAEELLGGPPHAGAPG